MTWSKLEMVWLLVASLVLSATACYYADWFYYVATISLVLHFILLGRGYYLGFLFGGFAVAFYGFYSHRLGMAFHLGAQGLYLLVNIVGALIWRYQYAFHKPQSLQSLPYWYDIVLTLILIVGMGAVSYNVIATGDVVESLRPFTIIGACVGTLMIIFGYHERWWVWIQVCSVATILWLLYYFQTGHGLPGVVAWLVALFSAVICHHTHRK